jgi:hypothetical protein
MAELYHAETISDLLKVAIDTSAAPSGKPLAASPEPASWPPYADTSKERRCL